MDAKHSSLFRATITIAQLRDEFRKKQKAESKNRKVRQAKISSNINDGLIALGTVIIIVAAAFGVFYYIRNALRCLGCWILKQASWSAQYKQANEDVASLTRTMTNAE